jgi:hypothetical protein
MRPRRFRLCPAVYSLLLLTSACDIYWSEVRAQQSRDSTGVDFVLANNGWTLRRDSGVVGLTSFSVHECGDASPYDRAVWILALMGRQSTDYSRRIVRITYGRVPEGYVQERGPTPLRPGACYEAVSRGERWEGATRFKIDSAGVVDQLPH